MSDNPEPVSLRDVYDLVGETRKELSTSIEKVNGDVTDVKVSVGKIETRLDDHDKRIADNASGIQKLQDQARQRLIRTASAGGLAGTIAAIILQIIAWITRNPTPAP